MAEEDHVTARSRPAIFTLPLRSRIDDSEPMAEQPPNTASAIPRVLASPDISVELHGESDDSQPRPVLLHPKSAPPDVQHFKSPMRHHKRTPSAHREIKETLDAKAEYIIPDDDDGRSHFRINQYTIKEEIGRGSFGAVHLATDQFGKEFAVKAFSKARLRRRAQSNILRHGPRSLNRFPPRAGFGAPDLPIERFSHQRQQESQDPLLLIREEIAIMKKLNHPNLVQLIEVLDDPEEDTLYMVLEMCKKGVVMNVGLGESATPYPEEQCRHWFRDLILGIEYLHSQGVVHRDIKPDNLLLTEDDIMKVVDFGVSEMFEKTEEMRTAKSAGSPAFLPPELCIVRHGDVSGKAADIWSMGVSLYCLRYGRVPFERSNVLDMYEAIKTETPQLGEGESPEFIDLMNRLLEKDPEQRITMADLREHPWVTRGGEDPLLSAEENCSDPVDLPNPLEINHAFTRQMSHLICVMKAIRKFKGLLASKRTPFSPSPRLQDSDDSTPIASPSAPERSDTADFAAQILAQRQKFHAQGGKAALCLGIDTSPERQSSSFQPVVLGIGTGGLDTFSHPEQDEEQHIVADSPTAVDFNIYDRAFDAEIDRIKRSSSRKGSSRKGTDEATMLYRTRLNRESHGIEDGDAGSGGLWSLFAHRQRESRSGWNGTAGGGEGGRFADLVREAVKQQQTGTKEEKTQNESGSAQESQEVEKENEKA
ncbi:kinase-like domain-containing protein [Podospora fimiseda]|uniref:Kinase-like domain-containing protein n=1 Tax=Podospora fimiseda TaxID=252190 RepID=A0AAN7BRV2_9PEZI|nr:kinase-like domain-containing protein [Podospora fimiseda]